MYKPIQTGIPRVLADTVHYQEFCPTESSIKEIVYCFWTLHTDELISEDFGYLVLPDGCIDIVFDTSKNQEFSGILLMTPSVQSETIRIRSHSTYVGIRLLPGAWQANPVGIVGTANRYDTLAGYDFTSASTLVRAANSTNKTIDSLQTVTRQLQAHTLVDASPLIKLLLAETFTSVQDMMAITGYSRRQLQRILHDSVGYTPHNFIKIIRFQHALSNSRAAAEYYFDQPHFIRECKRITGMTPVQLRTTYQLMTDISNK